jgi:aspartate racemase
VAPDARRAVVVLGTPSTITYGLYREALEARSIRVIEPDDRDLEGIESVIRTLIEGRGGHEEGRRLATIVDALMERGGEGVILGCAEIPLVFPTWYPHPTAADSGDGSVALLLRS